MSRFPNIRRGDDRSILGTFTLSTGAFTDCDVRLTFKERSTQTDAEAALVLDLESGEIEIVSGTTLRFNFPRAKTALLTKTRYFVSIRVLTPTDESVTVDDLDDEVTIVPDVTHETTP